MATRKRQLSITVSQADKAMLCALAEQDGVPIETKASELLLMYLEIEEDRVLSAIADERHSERNIKWVSGNDVWNL